MPNDSADVAAGAPHLQSYTDNHDGTVNDNVTHLMWQQSAAPGTYTFANNQAAAYCTNLSLGGHQDWRLPSRVELISINDYSVGNYRVSASIDTTAFPNTPLDSFWTSTIYSGAANTAWAVEFDQGLVDPLNVTQAHSVRCVR